MYFRVFWSLKPALRAFSGGCFTCLNQADIAWDVSGVALGGSGALPGVLTGSGILTGSELHAEATETLDRLEQRSSSSASRPGSAMLSKLRGVATVVAQGSEAIDEVEMDEVTLAARRAAVQGEASLLAGLLGSAAGPRAGAAQKRARELNPARQACGLQFQGSQRV